MLTAAHWHNPTLASSRRSAYECVPAPPLVGRLARTRSPWPHELTCPQPSPSSAGPMSASRRSSTGSTTKRAALVSDMPGLTRDRREGEARAWRPQGDAGRHGGSGGGGARKHCRAHARPERSRHLARGPGAVRARCARRRGSRRCRVRACRSPVGQARHSRRQQMRGARRRRGLLRRLPAGAGRADRHLGRARRGPGRSRRGGTCRTRPETAAAQAQGRR